MAIPEITEEMAVFTLAAFKAGIAASPSPRDRDRRNIDAMRKALDELRDLMLEVVNSSSQYSLSARQHQVMTLLARGSTCKQVSAELDLNINTVRAHFADVCSKWGVKDQEQAVALFLQNEVVIENRRGRISKKSAA